MKWEDVYEIKASKNRRGENVYDVYRKGDKDATWVDIPVNDIDKFLKHLVDIANKVAVEELENVLTETKEESKTSTEPLTVPYNRLRTYYGSAFFEDEEQ